MTIRYEEEQTFHWALLSLLLALIFIGFVMNAEVAKPGNVTLAINLVEIFLIFMLLNFLRLKIVVTDKALEFGFGVFRKTIQRSKIVSCRPFDVRFGQYFGIGIRLGLNNTILFNTRFGKAVRIKIRGHGRDYVVTTDHPEKLCRALKKR
jgi:hypothetical protein